MKIKILAFAMLAMYISTAKAQNYGTWRGAKEAVSWTYDLTTGTGSGKKFTASGESKSSESSKDKPGFLPYPPEGTAKVTVAANAGSWFALQKATLNFGASNSDAPNKFSLFDIPQASPVGSLFFTLSFNDGVKGMAVIAFGNSEASIFKNAASYNNNKQAGLFGAIRFMVGNTFTNPEHRAVNGTSYVHKAYETDLFEKSGSLRVEIYSNNSAGEQSFTRKGNDYIIPARTFSVFVNDKQLKLGSSGNLPATGELAENMAIDALLISGSNSSENSLNFSISNVKAGTLAQ